MNISLYKLMHTENKPNNKYLFPRSEIIGLYDHRKAK